MPFSTVHTRKLTQARSPSPYLRLFGYSITYVTLLFGAMMLDVFVEHGDS